MQTPPPGKSFARALEILRGIVSLKWPAPAGKLSRTGLSCGRTLGKRTCKPNSVVCGHSSRRRVAADAHQRPTRRFRQVLKPPGRIGPMRSSAGLFGACFPPYLVLLRVGFTLPRPLQDGRCALAAPFHPYPGAGDSATASVPGKPGQLGSCVSRVALQRFRRNAEGVAEAVSFLWHWPSMGLETHVPDVIRHTALRSSDFPPPVNRTSARPPAATARSSCQSSVYLTSGFIRCGRIFGRERLPSQPPSLQSSQQ